MKDLLPKEEAAAKFEKALKEDVLMVHQERKGKQRGVDVRPMIGSMEVKLHPPWTGDVQENDGWGVHLVLHDVLGRTAKPLEIVGTILGLGKDRVTQCEVVKIE